MLSRARACGDSGVLSAEFMIASADMFDGLPTDGHRDGDGITSEGGRVVSLLPRFMRFLIELDSLKGTTSESSAKSSSVKSSSNSVREDP